MKRGHMNKKGIDAVVTTVIIILLTLAIVAIIAVVIRNFANQGAQQIDIGTKCLNVNLNAVSVVPVANQTGNYTVTLNRAAGGSDAVGVKVNIFNSTANSGVQDFGTTLNPLDTKSAVLTGVVGANKIEYTAYFTDASGTAQICSQTGTYNF